MDYDDHSDVHSKISENKFSLIQNMSLPPQFKSDLIASLQTDHFSCDDLVTIYNENIYLNYEKYGPVITAISRHPVEDIQQINEEVTKDLIAQSKKLNRYWIYVNGQSEGVHSALGPDSFNMEKFRESNNVAIDIDQYESIFIWRKLEEMNVIMSKNKIRTIQSGIAYYECDDTFSKPYFQLPHIEFIAPIKKWPLVKMILDNAKKYDYLVSSYIETMSYAINDYPQIRFHIARPYVKTRELIKILDDTDFFNNVIEILKRVTTN